MSGASDEDPSGGLLFLTSALFLGILIRTLKPYLKLPYTVILLVVGVLFGVFRSLGAGKWGASVHSWNHLHPEYLFYMFLPPLIFSSAFEADHLIFTRWVSGVRLCNNLHLVKSVQRNQAHSIACWSWYGNCCWLNWVIRTLVSNERI